MPATALRADPAGSAAARGTPSPAAGEGAEITWLVAEEVPVAFEYNGRALVVMMATPADLEDFATGFSLCEGIVGAAADIDSIAVRPVPQGIVLDIRVDPLRLVRGSLRQRSMEGRSGCGLCGVDSLANAVRTPPRVVRRVEPSAQAVAAAFADLPDHQPMGRANRSVHAAGWCDRDGRVLLAREDVGRHNALDKLVGAMARAAVDAGGGFAVLTSRCSFELVQKAAAAGIGVLATMSGPTTLALDVARQAGVLLACRARNDGVVFFR